MTACCGPLCAPPPRGGERGPDSRSVERGWGVPLRGEALLRLLLPRGHDEHPVDLVPRRFVVDPVADTPDAAQAPLVEVRGVLLQEVLCLGVDLHPLLAVERRAALDDQVVQRLVAVIAVRLAA